eukprot:c26593_g1_i1 orf=113-1333(+)
MSRIARDKDQNGTVPRTVLGSDAMKRNDGCPVPRQRWPINVDWLHGNCMATNEVVGFGVGGERNCALYKRCVPACKRSGIREPEKMAEYERKVRDSVRREFSVLAAEIKAVWQGENSFKLRIESLGHRQQFMKDCITLVEEGYKKLKERLRLLEEHAKGSGESLQQMRKERIQSLDAAMTGKVHADEWTSGQSINGLLTDPSESVVDQTLLETRHIARIWKEDSCDLHLKRMLFSSRQIVAFEILNFAHKRLTCHLFNHISEIMKGLLADERTSYLSLFRQQGPFKDEPFSVGTYAEVLQFVQTCKMPRHELQSALKAAEDRLIEEAVQEGYSSCEVGDIRSQLTEFLQIEKQFRIAHCHPVLLSEGERTNEIIEDTKRAAEEGNLGVLQRASKLILLGCYLLCKG